MISPSQSLLLGLLEKRGALFVQLFDALAVLSVMRFSLFSTLELRVLNGEPRAAAPGTARRVPTHYKQARAQPG